MSSENDRVIVVGAGPVGLTAALALRRRGIETLVLASEEAPVMELRGSTFHPPTLDLLDEFALVPRMIEVGLKAPTWQFRDRETGPVATFDLSLLAGDTNHPYRVQCEQWKLMRFLEEKLGNEGVELRFGHEVTAVRQDDDGVTVTANTASGPVPVTGRYVIAADGARSAVRRSLGVEFEGFTYAELFLIASTDFPFENTLTDIAYVNYIADPLEWLVLLRVPGLWRVLVPAPENSDREKLLSDENLQAMLQRVVARPEPTRSRTLDLSRAPARGEKLPARPRAACGRRRACQQPARRHGYEWRHPGRVQPGGQTESDLGRRRRPAARPLRPATAHGCGRGGAAADPPQSAGHQRARSRDAEEIARRDAKGRGGQGIGARIHAAVIDDREHAAAAEIE